MAWLERVKKLKEAHSKATQAAIQAKMPAPPPLKLMPKDAKPAPKPGPNPMRLEDADTFLKLATALKIILARTILISHLVCVQSLLQDYLWMFVEVSIKPFVC